MEPDEVAEAFDILKANGKVLNFGVSNQDPYTMELMSRSLNVPLATNQLQLSITNATMISQPMNTNISDAKDPVLDNGVMNYCRLNNITIQPWSPFQYGMFEGTFMGNTEKFPKLNEVLADVASRYNVTPTGMAISWILRHPAKMQPIVGSVNLDRIRQIAAASDVTITHDEWYELYRSTGKTLP
jgi:predicted oxidoreductase